MLTALWIAVAIVATIYAALINYQLHRLATATEIQASIMNLSAPTNAAPCWGIVEKDDQIAIVYPDGATRKHVVVEVYDNNTIKVAPYLELASTTPTSGAPA